MRIVHDIECLPNFFSVAIVDYDSDREWLFEISERKNQINELIEFYKQVKYAIGFNSIHYDDIILNYLFNSKFKDWYDATSSLKMMSNYVINDDDRKNYEKYKRYKYKLPYKQIDLYLYWSKMLRLSKKLSLKAIAINLNWKLIKEFPLKHDQHIKLEQIDEFLRYNFNDAYITKELAKLFKSKINLRMDIANEYGIDCLSKDSIKIASDILSKAYSKESGLDFEEFDKRTFRESINLIDILLPFDFKRNEYKYYFVEGKIKIANDEIDGDVFGSKINCLNFYTLYAHLLTRTVKSTNEIAYSLNLTNPDGSHLHIDVLSGGIHGIIDKTIMTKSDDELIIDSDIASMYPNIIANHEFVPLHLDKDYFLNTYKGLIQKRIKAKRLKDTAPTLKERKKYETENEALKLCLNGTYGLFNNDYSWLKDMQVTLSTTINGQLMLCKLTELCLENSINVLMLNTKSLVL